MNEAAIELPARPSSVGQARAFVVEMMSLWDCDDHDQVAELLTTELVTNAIRHAERIVSVGVQLNGPTLRVEASDDDPVEPTVVAVAPEMESGRGMFLIEALASRWGVRRWAPPKKVVWFEITVTLRAGAAGSSRC